MKAEVHASRVGALKKASLCMSPVPKRWISVYTAPSATFTHLVVVRACLKYSAR